MSGLRMSRKRLTALSMVALVACDRTVPTPVQPQMPATSQALAGAPDSSQMQRLARGLALALRSASLRQQILADLRDSPFERHTIELASYLQGARGAALLDAAAQALQMGRADLAQLVASSGSKLAFVMPRSGDRLRWSGEENVAVMGIAEDVATYVQKAQARGQTVGQGYNTRGEVTPVELLRPDSLRLFLVSVSAADFGGDPEGLRAAAPSKGGRTIGEPDERGRPPTVPVTSQRSPTGTASAGQVLVPNGPSLVVDPCPGYTNPAYCDTGGGGGGSTTIGSGFLMLPSGQNWNQCVNAPGTAEPVNATCRAELAWAFRPRLILNSDEPCPWRQPMWSVKKDQPWGEIHIFYALSYLRDCGNRSQTFPNPHFGDSEFIILRISPVSSTLSYRWRLVGVFLSAHFGTVTDASWSGGAEVLEYAPYEYLTRPKIYVSWGKHGNYRDVGSCGRGGGYLDDCGRHTVDGEEIGIQSGSSSDLGNSLFRVRDCIANASVSSSYFECYWTSTSRNDFSGWTNLTPSATAYQQFLINTFEY